MLERLAVIFLTAGNIARSCIGSYCLVFAFRDSYLLERIRTIWQNNSISFCFLRRDHSISANNQESRAETEEVIPSRFSIKIWVGFFVFTKQNQLFQSLRAVGSDRDHRSWRRSCGRRLLVLDYKKTITHGVRVHCVKLYQTDVAVFQTKNCFFQLALLVRKIANVRTTSKNEGLTSCTPTHDYNCVLSRTLWRKMKHTRATRPTEIPREKEKKRKRERKNDLHDYWNC